MWAIRPASIGETSYKRGKALETGQPEIPAEVGHSSQETNGSSASGAGPADQITIVPNRMV